MYFLYQISKADNDNDYNMRAQTISKYLLKVGTLEWHLLDASLGCCFDVASLFDSQQL